MSVLLFGAASVSAQDVITMKNGEDVLAKVLEIDAENVKYRMFGEPDGAIYTTPKSQVLLIRHESGRNEVFDSASAQNYRYGACEEPAAGIVPGMKYKELKNIYNYEDWYSGRGDKYNPTLMGLCSFLIPGLGQMISGEVGRGFAWLGGAVGCYFLSGLTMAMGVAAMYGDNGVAGTLLMLTGPAAMLTVDVCAIVDACRVAKVKSMYAQDLRKMNYTINLHPSIDCIVMPNGIQPTAGLTLAMNF